MDARVLWKGNLSFISEKEGMESILLDTDTSVGGNSEGYEPMQLVAIGLAGCTAQDVISILKKKK